MPSFKVIKKHKTLEPGTVVEGLTRTASGWNVKLGPSNFWNVPSDCLEELGKPGASVDAPTLMPASTAPVVPKESPSSPVKPPPQTPPPPRPLPGLSKGQAASSPVKSLSKDEAPSLPVAPPRAPIKVHVALVVQNSVALVDPLKLQINFVWLGNGSLGALEKFTIYSWRALGHAVTVYALHFDAVELGTDHTVKTLGLVEDDGVSVVNIWTQLKADDGVREETDPKHMLRHARSLLQTWIEAIPPKKVRDDAAAAAAAAKVNADKAAALATETPSVATKAAATKAQEAQAAAEAAKVPTRDHIFNMVDVTKSYLGGSQRGIVLDLKVGPSWWLSDFDSSFLTKFISYSRGGKAVTVENQSMGTMEDPKEQVLRPLYAANFDEQIKKNVWEERSTNHNRKWFDLITSYHQRAFAATGKGIDVAAKAPQYPVAEIGDVNCGPFRVFKPASEQTNQGATKTDEEIAAAKRKVANLCSDVCKATEKKAKTARDQAAAFRLSGFAQEGYFLGKMKDEVPKMK